MKVFKQPLKVFALVGLSDKLAAYFLESQSHLQRKCRHGATATPLGYLRKTMDIKELTEEMNRFVRSKGWYEPNSKRPQTPRNLAISLALEAAEILEHFQWREAVKNKEELESELADVALYLLELASLEEIDLEQAILKKLDINKTREWDQE
jgi:NTP pyrophosphatase (non-canonical NTP hydrolase)